MTAPISLSSLRTLRIATAVGLSLWHGVVGAQQYDLRVFGVEDGLPGGSVDSIVQDEHGFLWIAAEHGTVRFDGRHFTPFPGSVSGGGAQPGCLRSRPLQPGGTSMAQGLVVAPGAQVGASPVRISARNGMKDDDARCILRDRSGVVWIGTTYGTLVRYTGDAVTWYDDRDGMPSPITLGFRFTGAGEVLISTKKGWFAPDGGSAPNAMSTMEVRLPSGHVWKPSNKGIIDSLPSGYILHVGRDTLAVNDLVIAGDSMLIGTANGLYRAPLDNSAAQWTHLPQAGIEHITSLAYDRAGNIWIGTAGRGVLRFRNNQVQRWTTAEHMASDRVRSLLLDAYQNLWVGTDRGFNLMELDELQEEVINVRYYGLEDGFPGIEAMPNACLLAVDSALWFGTTRGAIRFDPRRVYEDPIAPNTRITDIALFFEHPDWSVWSDSLDVNGTPIGTALPYDKNHLTFGFTGLSLAHPEKVRFQYMLEGHDKDWSPITADDKVTYSGLSPGTYTFLVKARNGSGVWNDSPARFTFVIEPPMWDTLGFRIIGGGALLLGFFAFQRLRDRRARRAREQLEHMVDQRTRELTDEKQRSDELLLNILPEITAAELKENGSTQARSYNACTVLFSDFQGFTTLSEQLEATGIVTELDRFFRAFDRITDTYGTEKIKTIGDAYMCASGVPNPSPTHALDAVLMALEMLSAVDAINAHRLAEGHPAWPIRIGLHSGPLIAGVVGEKKFAYDVWGDTVNLASRMESSGAAGRVHVTKAVMDLVGPFVIAEARGEVMLKGKGAVESWFIDRLRPEFSANAEGRKANELMLAERDRRRRAT